MKPRPVKIASRNMPYSVEYFSPHGVPKSKKKWLEDRELYEAKINDFKRVVTPVYLSQDKDKPVKTIYIMDAITGSLYDMSTGRCLTSNDLRMSGFTPKKDLGKRLLAIRTDVNRGLL